MKKALKRMAAAALVTLSVLRGGDAFAQNAVDGRVVDANGAPLVGVTVLIKGTQSGTATGANGSYSIKAREDQTLVFSYLGYTTVEEYVGKRTAINVKMTEEASQIGAVEIVNIGYGTTTRRDLTGSVAKADLGTMMKANVTNFDQALGGRIAGVVVTTGDGSLGAEANITIRGNNSLTQSNAPLYIIDGFPSEGSFAASINPADIESIDVLKDASATAIYGARGANGVIVINTKRGNEGKPTVNFSASFSATSRASTGRTSSTARLSSRTTTSRSRAATRRGCATTWASRRSTRTASSSVRTSSATRARPTSRCPSRKNSR